MIESFRQTSSSRECFLDTDPFLFSDFVFVDVNVISKCVQVSTKYKRCIHERARVNKFSFFSDLHFLYIEYEASIEDLRSQSTFTSKNHNLIVSNLVSQTHIPLNPRGFINLRSRNFLPNIFWDIIALNSVYNSLLVNSASKCKDEVIFEST